MLCGASSQAPRSHEVDVKKTPADWFLGEAVSWPEAKGRAQVPSPALGLMASWQVAACPEHTLKSPFIAQTPAGRACSPHLALPWPARTLCLSSCGEPSRRLA